MRFAEDGTRGLGVKGCGRSPSLVLLASGGKGRGDLQDGAVEQKKRETGE